MTTRPKKRLLDRVWFYAVLWVLSYTGCLIALKTLTFGKEAGIVLSLVPMLAFVLFIYKFQKALSIMNKVHIKMHMEGLALAFVVAVVLLMTLGLLDLVLEINKEDWGFRYLVPYFIFFYIVGFLIAKRKYSLEDEQQNKI